MSKTHHCGSVTCPLCNVNLAFKLYNMGAEGVKNKIKNDITNKVESVIGTSATEFGKNMYESMKQSRLKTEKDKKFYADMATNLIQAKEKKSDSDEEFEMENRLRKLQGNKPLVKYEKEDSDNEIFLWDDEIEEKEKKTKI